MQRKASGDEKILCTYTHPGHLTTPHPTALPPSSPIGCRHVTQNFSHYRRKRCRHIWSNLLLNVEFERTMNGIPRLIACVCMYVHCSAHGILNTPRKRGWLGAMGKDIKGWLTALPCTSHVATAGDNNRKKSRSFQTDNQTFRQDVSSSRVKTQITISKKLLFFAGCNVFPFQRLVYSNAGRLVFTCKD